MLRFKTAFALLALAALTGFAGVRDVQASHTVFIAQSNDPLDTAPRDGQRPNWVFRFWATGDVMRWKAIKSDGSTADEEFKVDVREAILMWTNALPFRFLEVPVTDPADVFFEAGSCPIGGPACTLLDVDTVWFGDTTRKAAHWTSTKVYLDPRRSIWDQHDPNQALSCALITTKCLGRAAAATHEIGHLIGLDERYLEPSVAPPPVPGGNRCNTNEDRIMNTSKLRSGLLAHCNLRHWPVPPDIDRAREFWEGHPNEWLPSSATKEEHRGVFTWTDQAWTEWERRVEFKYLEGATWTTFYIEIYTTNIGGHAWYTLDVRPRLMDRDEVFPTPPGNRWYVMCATPIFKGLYAPGAGGTGPCAPVVWLE